MKDASSITTSRPRAAPQMAEAEAEVAVAHRPDMGRAPQSIGGVMEPGVEPFTGDDDPPVGGSRRNAARIGRIGSARPCWHAATATCAPSAFQRAVA